MCSYLDQGGGVHNIFFYTWMDPIFFYMVILFVYMFFFYVFILG